MVLPSFRLITRAEPDRNGLQRHRRARSGPPRGTQRVRLPALERREDQGDIE
jgi:hypothetical protein